MKIDTVTRRRKTPTKISLDGPAPSPVRLTANDVARVHLAIRDGLYCSEQEIWQREADLLNTRLDAQYQSKVLLTQN
jgi:hypothetical protein